MLEPGKTDGSRRIATEFFPHFVIFQLEPIFWMQISAGRFHNIVPSQTSKLWNYPKLCVTHLINPDQISPRMRGWVGRSMVMKDAICVSVLQISQNI